MLDLLCRGLLVQLGTFDSILNLFLLSFVMFVVAPPHRSFVLTAESKMTASFATWLSFIAFLPPETAGEATCTR